MSSAARTDDAGCDPASSSVAAAPATLTLRRDGALRHRDAATPVLPALLAIADAQPRDRAGVRLRAIPDLSPLLTGGAIHALAAAALGPAAQPVRAVLFDKTATAN